MTDDARRALAADLDRRFGDAGELAAAATQEAVERLAALAAHRVIRAYADRPVAEALVDLVCAAALSAPTKSDLQQRDLVVVRAPETRARLTALCGGDPWMAGAPVWIVVCGNHRRQRQLHDWRGHPFANDHLDAFFNASVDAAIVLAWLVAAVEAAGLGCCPISQIRNAPEAASDLLGLPPLVFPVAGLTLGWPADGGAISPRLPLAATLHRERFDDGDACALVDGYDARREAIRPYRRQRDTARFGTATRYGWSEEKARHYAEPQRRDFGAFVRARGFKLD